MNMKKVAVIIAPGFEEGEALTIVDMILGNMTSRIDRIVDLYKR